MRGVGTTPSPRPERLYFWFGEPIAPARLRAATTRPRPGRRRDEVKRAILVGIQGPRDERDVDPQRALPARVLAGLRAGASDAGG